MNMNTQRVSLKLTSTPSQVGAWFHTYHGGKYNKYKRYFLNLSGAEILSLTPQQIGCRLGNTPADYARGEFLYTILHKGYRSSMPKIHMKLSRTPKKQRMIMEKLEPMLNDEDSDYCIKFMSPYKIWFDWPAVQLHYGISTTEAHFVRNLRTNYGWVKSCRCRNCVDCGTHKRGYWYHPDIADGSSLSIAKLLPRKVARPKNRPKPQAQPVRKRNRSRKRLRNYDDTLDWQPSDEALSPPTRPVTRLQKRKSDEELLMKSRSLNVNFGTDFPELVPSRSVSRSGSRGRLSPSSDNELVLPMLPPMPGSMRSGPLNPALALMGSILPPLPSGVSMAHFPMPNLMAGKIRRNMLPLMKSELMKSEPPCPVKLEAGTLPLPSPVARLNARLPLARPRIPLPFPPSALDRLTSTIKPEMGAQDRLSLDPIKVEALAPKWSFPKPVQTPGGDSVNVHMPGMSFLDSTVPSLSASKQHRAINLPQRKRRRLNLAGYPHSAGGQLSLMVPQLPSLPTGVPQNETQPLFAIKTDDASPISLPNLPELPDFAELLEAKVSSPRVEDKSSVGLHDINASLSPLYSERSIFSFDEYPLTDALEGQDLFSELSSLKAI